jgi:FkbM family methyltransferase
MRNTDDTIDRSCTSIEVHGKRVWISGLEGDHIASTIATSKMFYEWQLLGALSDYLQPNDYVIDVGANIGNHTLYFAAICEADVLAFEPLALAADVLQLNVEQNFLDDRVEIRRKPLGQFAARARLSRFDPENVGASAFALSPEGEYRVSALDLERIERKVSLIKVDAEGMDVAVLRGAADLIARDRPILVCEAATPTEQTSLEQLVSEIGYSFVAQFNATPTYIMAPARNARERAAMERRNAVLRTSTNLATRDLYYRIALVNNDLKSQRADKDTSHAELSKRIEQLEALVGKLAGRLGE